MNNKGLERQSQRWRRSFGGLLVFLCFTGIDFTGEEKTKEQQENQYFAGIKFALCAQNCAEVMLILRRLQYMKNSLDLKLDVLNIKSFYENSEKFNLK